MLWLTCPVIQGVDRRQSALGAICFKYASHQIRCNHSSGKA